MQVHLRPASASDWQASAPSIPQPQALNEARASPISFDAPLQRARPGSGRRAVPNADGASPALHRPGADPGFPRASAGASGDDASLGWLAEGAREARDSLMQRRLSRDPPVVDVADERARPGMGFDGAAAAAEPMLKWNVNPAGTPSPPGLPKGKSDRYALLRGGAGSSADAREVSTSYSPSGDSARVVFGRASVDSFGSDESSSPLYGSPQKLMQPRERAPAKRALFKEGPASPGRPPGVQPEDWRIAANRADSPAGGGAAGYPPETSESVPWELSWQGRLPLASYI